MGSVPLDVERGVTVEMDIDLDFPFVDIKGLFDLGSGSPKVVIVLRTGVFTKFRRMFVVPPMFPGTTKLVTSIVNHTRPVALHKGITKETYIGKRTTKTLSLVSWSLLIL